MIKRLYNLFLYTFTMQQRFKERIYRYEEAGLGLERNNTVRFEPYKQEWSQFFDEESKLIAETLSISSLILHHAGSTSITTIVAKPIIDIVGEVDDINSLDKKSNLLEEIGYQYKGEYGVPGRRYCPLYNPSKDRSYFHLHIFQKNSKELQDHLLFKDYLIQNPSAAKRYESVKVQLNLPRSEYSPAKTDIIKELLREAYEYFK